MLEQTIGKEKTLTAENAVLNFKNEFLEKKMSVIKWYMDVMEDGIDTREISRVYYELK